MAPVTESAARKSSRRVKRHAKPSHDERRSAEARGVRRRIEFGTAGTPARHLLSGSLGALAVYWLAQSVSHCPSCKALRRVDGESICYEWEVA